MDSYTEADVVNLLCDFGFEYEHDNIYVIPQSSMAFVLMPNQHAVMNIIRASLHHCLILKNKHLFLNIVRQNISMNPLCFYKALMGQTPFQLTTDGTSLIYIRNITPSETSDLKEALKKIGSVANYLPLLNKVFIEFHSMHDADRLGVWYSFLKDNVCHIVERIKLPRSPKKSKPPQLPMNALPDIKLIKPGAEIPNAKYGIPQGTTPPFWITMTTNPYVFSTASPWFNIPDFLTLQGKNEPFITYHLGSGYCTVMLTGLPEGNYRHEDVAKLVWRYFPKQNLQTLYYNILVLPLQRRAFVYFCSREACCSFVRDHNKKPVSVGNRPLQVHFIVQDIRHESSEAMMYRTLMKWSNAHISEIDFLEQRLLCVELSEMSVDLIKKVVTEVASISCFINFLPLANRICIEMVESSGVRKVLDEISLKGDLSTHKTWSKVLHVESVKDLKQRLQDSSEVTVDLTMNVSQVGAKPQAVKTKTQVDSDKPAMSAESTISKSEAVFKERAAEPPNISKSDKPQDRAPEHPITSEYEVNPEEKATKPLKEVYETENKQEEARVPETLKASKPEVKPDKEATKPSDVSKSVSKPDERTAETSKATKPDKQVAKPANASTLDIKPEENVAKSTTVSKLEDQQERDPKTIKASQPEVKPDKPTPKHLNKPDIKPVDRAPGPPNASKPEIKIDKPTPKPSNVSKPQIKPGVAPGPPNTSKPEIKIDKPTPKPSNVSKLQIKPDEAPGPPNASKPEIKIDKPTPKPSNISKLQIKPDEAPGPPNASKPEIKIDKPTPKPSNVSKPQIKPGVAPGPPNASKPEIKIDKPTPKPSNISKLQIKPDEAPGPPNASKPEIKIDKPTPKPSNVSKPQINPGVAPGPPNTSKPEIKLDKPTPKPTNVSKLQIKPGVAPGPPNTSKPEIKLDKPTPKPTNVSKLQIKPDGAPESSKASQPEIKIDKPAPKPLNVSKPQIKPGAAPGPLKASKPEIKPEKTATKPPAASTSENKHAPETPKASTPENKPEQDGKLLNASNCESKPEKMAPELPKTSATWIKTDKPDTKPVNVSKPEEKAAEPSKDSQSEIKPAPKPSNVSKPQIKPEDRAPEPSKAPEKPATKPPVGSTSESKDAPETPKASIPENKSVKQDGKLLNASNCENKLEKRAPGPPKTSVPVIKTDQPATKPVNVSKPEIKPEEKATESSKASLPEIKLDKPTTNLSNVSTSDIKSEEKAAKPPTVSKSENKQEENKAPEPPKMSVPGIETDKAATKPSNVSKPEIRPEEKITEHPRCVFAPKAETVSVTPPHQTFKETSAAAGPGTAVKTQIASASNAVSNISTSTADRSVVKKPPAAATTPAATLTFGEKIESLLIPQKISCLGKTVIMSPKSFSLQTRLLLITNLPEPRYRCYTEHDFVKLLQTFGFQYEDKNIYILPRACLAFVLMPSFQRAKDVFVASTRKHLTFLGSQLVVQIISKQIFMTPFGFYKSLLKEINYIVVDDGTNTIYINNISPEEVENLRETLNKIKSVKNFLPLLNKVFIEFDSSRDADRIGVWYSLLKHCPAHNVYRMKIPRSSTNAHAPRLAANALPDSKDMVSGAIAPTTNFGVPQGSTPPFSVTLTTHPFVFPTSSPWFIIPAFMTVETKKSLWTSVTVASELSTVMLTGLPEGNYKHEDVAKLVWRYFPKQNLQTLYYNILVLPLQRRAFVYFSDWKSCLSFLEDAISNPVSVKDHTLHVHLVLQDMHPGSSEEIMYRSLMKWSNAHVPELESLQERLLCVELSETSIHLIITVMKCVTSIAPIVSFLPLANRICIEMSEPSGVKQAMEKISMDITCLTSHVIWRKVRRVESLCGEYLSLKRRLQDCSEMTVNLDQGTKDMDALTSGPPPSEASEKTTQPASQGAAKLLQVAPASKEGTASTTQTSSQDLASTGAKEKLTQTAVNILNVSSRSSSEKQPDASGKREESSVGPQDTNGSSEAKGEEPVDTKPSPAKPAPDLSQRAQTTLKTLVKASSEAQEPKKPNPESTATTGSSPAFFLTPREKIPQLRAAAQKLYQRSLKPQVILSNKLLSMLISLVITKLPDQTTSCYTEADIIKLLHKYEIQCENDKLFIIPQAKMAFVFLPNVEKVQKFFKESKFRNVVLKGSKLFFSVISISNSTPLGFYTFLKSLVGFRQRITDPTKVVYMQNIPQSEVSDLWLSIKRVGRVMNYLPLLNKVFVEFVDICDADRLGVCYSFLKQRFSYSIYRMGLPRGFETSKAPRQVPQALPHRSVTTSRATFPTAPSGIPEGTIAPFWVTMTTNPYVFPTVSPWFNIPAIFTVRNIEHIKEQQHSRFPVIMLTGLPNETFTHEEVAKLVWKYFPEQNLYSLYFDVVVLPLQRRAFVHFHTWAACFRFLQDHIRNPVCLKNCALYIHIVLNEIHLRSCEVNLYKILMKWSNTHVPDLKSLEERLLCVEVSGMNERLISTVMKEVASIATFVSFLPLANRIYIEMAESSGVRKVAENLSVSVLSDQCETWKQVGRIESLKSRKLRLQDCKRIAVNLDQGTIDVFTESTVKSSASSDKKTPETSSYDSPGSTVCEPARAAQSGTAIKEESTEVTVCSAVDPKSDVKTEKKEEESVPLPPRGQVQPHVEAADLPSVNMDHFRALKEAINQYKLSKEAQEGTEDVHSSEACVQPHLNFEDLVTIDEINEDVEDKDVDNSSSSSKPASREKRGDRCFDASSEASKTSSSSSSRSTATSRSSEFTSVSVESQKHSPEPNESQTNPLSSASDSKTSLAASSLKSVETHVSPGRKAQPSKATPSRTSQSSSTGQSTSSSATAAKTSVETHQSHEKEDEPTESSVAEFDHKVSAESSTETQIPGPEKDQVLQQEGLQVLDGAEADETKTNASVKDEDKRNATEDESATAGEKKHLVKDEGSTVKPDQTRVSEMEENQNSQLKQDGSLTGDRETVKDNKERVSKDPVQEDSVSKRSVRRSTRGTKDQTTTQDKATSDEPTFMTRSTRGRRKTTAEDSTDESKEKETPMKPRRTPVRDVQKPNKEDSPKTDDITTTKNINTVRDSCEPKTSQQTSEDFKEPGVKEQEAPTPRKRGRPRKEARLPTPVPVRKSTRGINLESPDGQMMKGGVEELKERCSMDEKNVLNKRKMKLVGPEAKRSRSQSPRVAADVKLPAFNPEKPLGKEFVSRRWGYFCHLCSVSYLDEGTTKDQHCSSQTHHENLQKYHRKLRQKPSRTSTQNSQ